jgi:hypothetical protein
MIGLQLKGRLGNQMFQYAAARTLLSDHNQGWLLPMTYCRSALVSVPRGAALAIFSDDPEWAKNEFVNWRPWVARGNSAVVDMLLMTVPL